MEPKQALALVGTVVRMLEAVIVPYLDNLSAQVKGQPDVLEKAMNTAVNEDLKKMFPKLAEATEELSVATRDLAVALKAIPAAADGIKTALRKVSTACSEAAAG